MNLGDLIRWAFGWLGLEQIVAWTAVASLVAFLEFVLLLRVFKHERRALEIEGAIVRAKISGEPDGSSVAIEVWNEGRKDTQIRDCYLETTQTGAVPKRTELKFSYLTSQFNETTGEDVSFALKYRSFVRETLRAGELWPVRVHRSDAVGIRAEINPTIIIVPVLGSEFRLKVEDPLKIATTEGVKHFVAGQRQGRIRRIMSIFKKPPRK